MPASPAAIAVVRVGRGSLMSNHSANPMSTIGNTQNMFRSLTRCENHDVKIATCRITSGIVTTAVAR